MGEPMIVKKLRERRAELVTNAETVSATADAHSRSLSGGEQRVFDEAMGEIDKIDERLKYLAEGEQRVKDVEESFAALTGRPAERGAQTPHPLAYTSQALDAIQNAIDTRSAAYVEAGEVEQRATLVTTTFGAPRVWGSSVLAAPRLLHVVAGVPQQPSDAVLAQLPVLTLPTASAAVGEGVTLGEYATSTAGSVTLARYGRWTDLSRESLVGTDAGALTSMHRIGVARDLDKVLIDAVETAAGSAVAFSADVPAAIRKAMAGVIDNTAAADAADLVILVHPDNAALLENVTPIGGQTIAEPFQRFSGALVYPSSAVNTGFMTVANLRAGARYFEARGLVTETDLAVKTGVQTVATSVIGGYGIGLAGGAFAMVDVVTP